jgi:3-methylfumaryl-CoA hydratase
MQPTSAPEQDPLQDWVGRSETRTDTIDARPVALLSATLDRDDAPPRVGDPLPPLWHWLYFLPCYPVSEAGPDGHAKRGGFLPPVPLPRRMWAGSRLEWMRPLVIGDAVTRTSRILSIRNKRGASGELVFVVVRHELATAGGLALTEEHDIVYRDLSSSGAVKPIRAPESPQWKRRVVPDDVLLFRYSALTFNSHRIHYDRRYVTEVEGYPGLVVHGPLLATLLADLPRRHGVGERLRRFEFRASRPLFDIAPFDVCGKPDQDGKILSLWAQGEDGAIAMQATATL